MNNYEPKTSSRWSVENFWVLFRCCGYEWVQRTDKRNNFLCENDFHFSKNRRDSHLIQPRNIVILTLILQQPQLKWMRALAQLHCLKNGEIMKLKARRSCLKQEQITDIIIIFIIIVPCHSLHYTTKCKSSSPFLFGFKMNKPRAKSIPVFFYLENSFHFHFSHCFSLGVYIVYFFVS